MRPIRKYVRVRDAGPRICQRSHGKGMRTYSNGYGDGREVQQGTEVQQAMPKVHLEQILWSYRFRLFKMLAP